MTQPSFRLLTTLKLTLTCSLLASLIATPLSFAQPQKEDMAQLQTQAKILVQKFSGELKPQLKKALQTGGPLQAIEVCATSAPEIARTLSQVTGWDIKRVSLQPRNDESARPDTWEHNVLQDFNQRQQDGEAVVEINYSEQIDGRFRFMQAQAVEPICLACHGQHLSPEVEQSLKKYYPKDQATGYSLGQIRGAFSLSKPL